ncbi:MAG: Holliday junction resolvase RuvX [Dehalococcoidia bacterium]|nr:Holliday junction resolvase RuvX [Dehalococcoidia bacterium]
MSYLALDVGDRRIGVAGADPEGIVVTPITTLTRRSDRQVVAAITDLAADRGAEIIVVGMPYTPQGELGEQARRVQDFARRLEKLPGLDVVYWDERYSTLEASDRLRETGVRHRRRRGRPARIAERERLDAAAAAVILQDFLDAQHEDATGEWPG